MSHGHHSTDEELGRIKSLKINEPIPFYMMVECLKILLEREGEPDFAGLTVVEDAE